MKAGFIGLGAMGTHMARNISQASYLHAVWNRTRSKAEALSKQWHLPVVGSPEDLARQVDLVFCCVSADKDVMQIINAILPGIKPGDIVVDLSTVSSETARAAAFSLEKHEASFLDSPVSGGIEGARNGTLAMMVGGDAQVLGRVMPVLEAMGERIIHMGPVGSGQNAKAVNQIMAAGINEAVTEALAFGEYQGLDMDRLIEVVSNGAAGNWFLQHRGVSMTQDSFAPGFKLKLHHKDLKICQQAAWKSNCCSGVVDRILEDYETLMEQGYGDEDISALYRLKRPE